MELPAVSHHQVLSRFKENFRSMKTHENILTQSIFVDLDEEEIFLLHALAASLSGD